MNQKSFPVNAIKNEPKTPVIAAKNDTKPPVVSPLCAKPVVSPAGDNNSKPGFRAGPGVQGPPRNQLGAIRPAGSPSVIRPAGVRPAGVRPAGVRPAGAPTGQGEQRFVAGMKRPLPVQTKEPEKAPTPVSGDGNGKEQAKGTSDQKEKKFTGRCRLFVGNLPNDLSEEDFKKLFAKYGESNEVFVNAARGFGFIRLDTRHHAEDARKAVDGLTFRNRPLRVRFAAHSAALRVKYLSQHVSNEMLAEAFSIFGDIERAIVIVDDRGKPTGEGIVEFARKPGAMTALKRISEGVFLLTSSPRPIAVELLEQTDETDGLPEVFFQKSGDLVKEREQQPRFAQPGSFEYEFGLKWKTLYQLLCEQQEALKKNFEEEVAKMELDMETAIMEQHTVLLRQDLQRRQEELRRLEEQTQMEVKRRLEARRNEDDRRRPNSADVFSDFRRTQKSQEDELFSGSMDRRGGFLGRGQTSAVQEGGRMGMLPPPALIKQTPEAGHMVPPPGGLQRNERGPGLIAPPLMNRTADRPGIGGLAPPLQPPPVPPGVDRARLGGQQLGGIPGLLNPLQQSVNGDKGLQQVISAAQQISKLISPMVQQNPRARFEHPQQGLQGPAGNMRPGGPGFDNPRMGGPGSLNDHFDPKRMRRF